MHLSSKKQPNTLRPKGKIDRGEQKPPIWLTELSTKSKIKKRVMRTQQLKQTRWQVVHWHEKFSHLCFHDNHISRSFPLHCDSVTYRGTFWNSSQAAVPELVWIFLPTPTTETLLCRTFWISGFYLFIFILDFKSNLNTTRFSFFFFLMENMIQFPKLKTYWKWAF